MLILLIISLDVKIRIWLAPCHIVCYQTNSTPPASNMNGGFIVRPVVVVLPLVSACLNVSTKLHLPDLMNPVRSSFAVEMMFIEVSPGNKTVAEATSPGLSNKRFRL